MEPSRRKFCKNSLKIVAGTSLASILPGQVSCSDKNDKLVIGAIGIRNQGFANIRQFLSQPNVECAALCDVDTTILNERAAQIEKQTGIKPGLYKDFRKLLEDKDIDAVIISTPDHWHCIMMVMALEAGKHVFVEKPLANTIAECQIMEKAARKYKGIVTVGQWQRSGKHWQDAMAFVHTGELGKISRVKAWAYTGKPKLPVVENGPVPDGVDYGLWLGPAPKRPFNKNRFHYNFRYYWDYAGGLMTDWGVHMLDFALYGMQAKTPNAVTAMGGKFSYPDGARETPDTLQVLYEYEDYVISWEHSVCLGKGPENRNHGVAFQGNNGTLIVTRNGWQVYPEKLNKDEFKMEEVPPQPGTGGFTEHVQNFIECIKSRREPNCTVKMGKEVGMVAHMGNLAFRTGERLRWDKKTNEFTGNITANQLISPEYSSPWELPKI